MASPERLSTASSHSTPAATRFTLSTGEYSSCTHTHIGACTAASQQEGPGFDSRMGRCWYWGQVLLQCSGGLSSGPFCVEFACSPRVHKGFPRLRTQTEKTCKRTDPSPSVPDLTWSPGAAHCSWSPGGRTVRDGINAEDKFTTTSGLCVLCCLHVLTCVSLVRVKSDNYYYYYYYTIIILQTDRCTTQQDGLTGNIYVP